METLVVVVSFEFDTVTVGRFEGNPLGLSFSLDKRFKGVERLEEAVELDKDSRFSRSCADNLVVGRASYEVSLSLSASVSNGFGVRLDTRPGITLGKEVVEGFVVELVVETAPEPLAGRAKDAFLRLDEVPFEEVTPEVVVVDMVVDILVSDDTDEEEVTEVELVSSDAVGADVTEVELLSSGTVDDALALVEMQTVD